VLQQCDNSVTVAPHAPFDLILCSITVVFLCFQPSPLAHRCFRTADYHIKAFTGGWHCSRGRNQLCAIVLLLFHALVVKNNAINLCSFFGFVVFIHKKNEKMKKREKEKPWWSPWLFLLVWH
jgi:hypothetical protein